MKKTVVCLTIVSLLVIMVSTAYATPGRPVVPVLSSTGKALH